MLNDFLRQLLEDEALYGYCEIDEDLKKETGCKCALVTLLPFPDMDKKYRPDEFYEMSGALRAVHTGKMNACPYHYLSGKT